MPLLSHCQLSHSPLLFISWPLIIYSLATSYLSSGHLLFMATLFILWPSKILRKTTCNLTHVDTSSCDYALWQHILWSLIYPVAILSHGHTLPKLWPLIIYLMAYLSCRHLIIPATHYLSYGQVILWLLFFTGLLIP